MPPAEPSVATRDPRYTYRTTPAQALDAPRLDSMHVLTHAILTTVAIAGAAHLPAQQFTKQTAPLGITTVPHADMITGSGLCVADFDGDGDIDAFIPSPAGGPFNLLRNDGGMQFTDVSATSGLGVCADVRCCVAADIDNDGDQDVAIGNDDDFFRLFVNQGNMTFTEESWTRGLFVDDVVFGATFGDYDNDGWLDLYLTIRTDMVVGLPDANRLYRNTGNGMFVDTTATAGVGSMRPTLVSTWMDYDEDGWVDLLLCNDKGLSFGPNELYRNNGDGTFTDVSVQTGTNIAVDGMGVDFTDVFCDGGVDFYVTDLPITHLFQVWDPTTNAYLSVAPTYGVMGGAVGWACHWLDYDNDGWQDLHVVQHSFANRLYRNPQQPAAAQVPWTDEAPALGIALNTFQYNNVMADFDDDGRVDILDRFNVGFPSLMAPEGTALYRNEVVGGNWIKFDPEGRVSNRDGFGTRIVVETGDGLLHLLRVQPAGKRPMPAADFLRGHPIPVGAHLGWEERRGI